MHVGKKTAEKQFKELKMKFSTAYMIACEELPSPILLIKKKNTD